MVKNEKTDTIDFELTNAYEDAVYLEPDDDIEYMKRYPLCRIYINGKDIRDVVKDTELTLYKDDPEMAEFAGHYLHVEPDNLYDDLTDQYHLSSDPDYEGATLLICGACGIAGCSDIDVYIRSDENYVYWENMYCTTDSDVILENYCFERSAYEAALEKLHGFYTCRERD